jgi:hypothetical protein
VLETKAEVDAAGVETNEAQAASDAWMNWALHGLCQPLMALECLLYLNQEEVADEPLEAGRLRSVLEEASVECGRMIELVRAMQVRLQRKSDA